MEKPAALSNAGFGFVTQLPGVEGQGVSGLRVADASVMPEHVTVNPNITVMMIGERCADLIRASRTGETTAVEAELSAALA